MSALGVQADRRQAWVLWLVGFVVPLWCGAQAPVSVPSPAPEAPLVRFRALDVHDRQEALADLLHRLILERDSRREEHRAYMDADRVTQSLSTLADDDRRLSSSMALFADLAHLGEQLKESRLRRLEILDRIQAQAAQTGPDAADSVRILREADAEVRLMLSQQAEQGRRMGLLERQLSAFVRTIPPPAEFNAASAVTMRLVGAGEDAFYVSAAPIPVALFQRFLQSLPAADRADAWIAFAAGTELDAALTGVSWYEARRFCQWLSVQDGLEYRLPSVKEATVLSTIHPVAGLAFWGDGVWDSDDHVARRDLKRFGVELATGWDPAAVLAPGPGSFADVPFARYPSLTIYVVAARQAGVAQRWQRLKATLP